MKQDHDTQHPSAAHHDKQHAAQERVDLQTGVLSGATSSEEIALNSDETSSPQRIGSVDAETNAELTNNGGIGGSDG